LRAELIERGYDARGFITIDDALESLSRGTSSKPDALILELRGQNLTRQIVDAIRDLRVPTILLGGNSELNDPLVTQSEWKVILKRPFSLGTVADVVQKLVPRLTCSRK